MKEKILGVLYGMAIGDSMGMPPELWGRKKARRFFGGLITDFLDGPAENEVSKNYKKGEFTDDTSQALLIIDSLAESSFKVDKKIIAKNFIKWANDNNAYENNILGPTSKVALKLIENNEDPFLVTNKALSNGSAMRIAPIGTLFLPDEINNIAEYVYKISSVTHSSDVTVAGAAIIAMAVSSALVNNNFNSILDDIFNIEDIASMYGEETFSPNLTKRIKLGIKIADEFVGRDLDFINELYDVIGTGVNISESVPTAVSIAYYAQNVQKAAFLSTNIGGDTDTIGAMACAICGAFTGIGGIKSEYIDVINANNKQDISNYARLLFEERKRRGI